MKNFLMGKSIQADARANGVHARPRWPAIVLRTPKGWTGPKVVNNLPVEGTFRAHQVPMSNCKTDPVEFAMLDEWLRSYRPQELFDANGAFVSEVADLSPKGDRRMSANPHGNGGKLLVVQDLATQQAIVAEATADGEAADNPLVAPAVARVRALPESRPRLWFGDAAFCEALGLPADSPGAGCDLTRQRAHAPRLVAE